MLYCEKCGAYSPDNSKFCIQCGSKFDIYSTNDKNISINELVTKLQNEGYTIINENDKAGSEPHQQVNVVQDQQVEITRPEPQINVNVQPQQVSINKEAQRSVNVMKEQQVQAIKQEQQVIPEPKTIVNDLSSKKADSIKPIIRKITLETDKKNKKEKTKKEKISKEEKKAHKKELKEAKKVSKEILTTTKELLDFIDIDEQDRIITKTGIINLFQIQTKDIYSFSPTDRNIHIFNFVHFIRGLEDDFKIITMKFPVSTKVQQEHIRKRINKTNNDIYKVFLNEKLEELENLEQHRFNKEFYLMTFYKLDDDIEQKEKKLGTITSTGVNLYRMSVEKKIRILHKLNNMNSKLY